MATERDLEQLDDYLSNRMTAGEKAGFEQKLQADSELANELNVQQELIKGIQQARVAELKAMLNNVPVPAIPHATPTSVLLKFAAGTVIVGAVATGIYFLIGDNTQKTETRVENTTEVKDDVPVTTSEEKSDNSEAVKSEEKSKEQEVKPVEKKEKAENKTTTAPKIDVYDPTEESEGTEDQMNEAETRPALNGKAKASVGVTIDNNNASYTFHYQYKEGKLFLYGPFEANLYEILEFFSDNQRTVFLRYKSDYYLLKEIDQKIRPLTKITDPALINKLDESRSQK